MQDFWQKVESITKEDIPDILKTVLEKTGYTSLISISRIDNEHVREMNNSSPSAI